MSKLGIFIVGAKRTAFGSFGGMLKNHSATDLAEIAGRGALKNASISPENVDHVVFGNVIQSSKCAMYLARHAGLRMGIPDKVPAYGVNRLCGSGFQAVVEASQQIALGDSSVVLAGGTESMSQAPFVVRDVRFGTKLFDSIEFEDVLRTGLLDAHVNVTMGMTAENVGTKFGISREQADEYALRSQMRWRLANNAGHLEPEIEPIMIKSKKGQEVVFAVDEHPRETALEDLAKLTPVFKPDGLVTAGNASGVCDGAAAVVLASEEAVKKLRLNPLARVVGWNIVGCDPAHMGIGPVGAIRGLCDKTGVSLDKVDMIEVNEAFAAQVLAVQKELGLDGDQLNMDGGAIAIGHPLGASGARITAHLAHEIKRRGSQYAIGSACVGGGQGIAILLEKV